MNRRDFILSTAVGAALGNSSSGIKAAEPLGIRKRALMKLGCQSGPTSDKRLQFFPRHVGILGSRHERYRPRENIIELLARADPVGQVSSRK